MSILPGRIHLWLLSLVLVASLTSPVWASSTIIDGTVTKITKGGISVHVDHTPYSSVSSAKKMLTRLDGARQDKYLNWDAFLSYYIDEIPVTREQFLKVVKPGVRIVMMQNRKKNYFIYVSTRGQNNRLGMLKSIDKESGTMVIEREQLDPMGGGYGTYAAKEGDVVLDGQVDESKVQLDLAWYPNHKYEIQLNEDAEVLIKGKRVPWREAKMIPDTGIVNKRKSYLVQTARPAMRVEWMPAGYGEWEQLINRKDLMYGKREIANEIRHQVLVVSKATGLEKKKVNIRPPHWPKPEKVELKTANGFACFRLAGYYNEEPENMWMPIYSKGQAVIVDGMYATNVPHWEGAPFVQPGRIMVCFQRRGRLASDRFAFSSEYPVGWGEIIAIDVDTVTLRAPEIPGAPVSGEHKIKIPSNATMHHLGLPAERSEVLQVGNLLQIYPARPQTVVINAGL